MPDHPLAQTAICPPMHRHGLFLSFDLAQPAAAAALPGALAALGEALDVWAAQDAAARSCWAIGIGGEHWSALCGTPAPRELAPFPQFADAEHRQPATPHALFIHLRSERHDLCYQAGVQAHAALAGLCTLAEAVSGFRYLDARDLTGFVDGTENPAPDERPAVALVDDDADFNGGSYLHVQRYVHDMARWRHTAQATQERVIGRTKHDDVELDDAHKPASAHIARVVIEHEGEELQIVRQSMPYGTVGGEAGLMFLSYCKTPTTFTRMLERMVTRHHGPSDHLLHFTRAAGSAAYFMPPRAMLASWAL